MATQQVVKPATIGDRLRFSEQKASEHIKAVAKARQKGIKLTRVAPDPAASLAMSGWDAVEPYRLRIPVEVLTLDDYDERMR
jgi:hypothetical protein